MIFIDSNAFIALYTKTHPLHKSAITTAKYLLKKQEEIITTNIVIAETLTILSMRYNKKDALKFWKTVTKDPTSIIYIDEYYQYKAWEIFQKLKSKNVSFFDCTSFAVMNGLGVEKVFTFDIYFKNYGFKLLN